MVGLGLIERSGPLRPDVFAVESGTFALEGETKCLRRYSPCPWDDAARDGYLVAAEPAGARWLQPEAVPKEGPKKL